jgi:hypothetical protein
MPDDNSRLMFLAEHLRDCHGADSAITIAQIGDLLCLGRRQTETFLELHLADLPFCVISSSSGYYRPTSADEINHYRNSLRSRIRCLAIRARTVARAAAKEGWSRAGTTFTDRPTVQELPLERRPA